jgi:hypothetical protein
MVLMGMTDQNRRRPGQIERFWQQIGGAIRRVERPPGVEDKTVAGRMLDFNAGPADLLRTAMDGKG